MKKIFTVFFTLFLFSTSIIAQVNFNNQVIVYFKSGVQRNAPNYTTATISSTNVLNVLSSYGIPTSNVVPSFPNIQRSRYNFSIRWQNYKQLNRRGIKANEQGKSI